VLVLANGCGAEDTSVVGGSASDLPATSHTHANGTHGAAARSESWELDATTDEIEDTRTLIARTQAAVAQVPSLDAAAAAGYLRVNKRHLINVAYMLDDKVLDPSAIESLVVGDVGGSEGITGGMYALSVGSTLADVPALGGPLLVWHAHGTLCATPAATLVPVDRTTDTCPTGSTAVRDLPMIHVWSDVQPNDDGSPRDAETCGVFQYLDLPHTITIDGCSGKSAGGGHAVTEE
jgi:hypothetical protein